MDGKYLHRQPHIKDSITFDGVEESATGRWLESLLRGPFLKIVVI